MEPREQFPAASSRANFEEPPSFSLFSVAVAELENARAPATAPATATQNKTSTGSLTSTPVFVFVVNRSACEYVPCVGMSRRDVSALIIAMRPRWRRDDDVIVLDAGDGGVAEELERVRATYNCVVTTAAPVRVGSPEPVPEPSMSPCDRLVEFVASILS